MCVECHSDGHFYEDSVQSVVIVRNVDTGAVLRTFLHYKKVTVSCISDDGNTVVVVEESGWDAGVEKTVVIVRHADAEQQFEHENYISKACLAGDGKRLVTVEHGEMFPRHHGGGPKGDAIVTVRDVETGAKILVFRSEQPVSDCCLSGDGKTLATVETDDEEDTSVVTVRSVDTGAEIQKFEHGQVVTSSSLSRDGKTLAYVETDMQYGYQPSTVVVQNVDTGAHLHTGLHTGTDVATRT
jgi:WD40 repeat protein